MRFLGALLLIATLAPGGDAVLNDDTFEAWRARITPTQKERPDEAIDWAPTLSDGLKRAHQQGKPLLLWMMNGHPLGCT